MICSYNMLRFIRRLHSSEVYSSISLVFQTVLKCHNTHSNCYSKHRKDKEMFRCFEVSHCLLLGLHSNMSIVTLFVSGKLEPSTKPQTQVKRTLPAVDRPVAIHPRKKKQKISSQFWCLKHFWFSNTSDMQCLQTNWWNLTTITSMLTAWREMPSYLHPHSFWLQHPSL
jgi:hypothetical protein